MTCLKTGKTHDPVYKIASTVVATSILDVTEQEFVIVTDHTIGESELTVSGPCTEKPFRLGKSPRNSA